MSDPEIVEALGLLIGWPLVVLVVGLLFGPDLLRLAAVGVSCLFRTKLYIVEKRVGGKRIGGAFESKQKARNFLRDLL